MNSKTHKAVWCAIVVVLILLVLHVMYHHQGQPLTPLSAH